MGAWNHGLYDNDAALDARGELLSGIGIPDDPPLFAATIGLLALLDPTADQFAQVKDHAAMSSLPSEVREAAQVAAFVGASGPCLPYRQSVREVLGIDASYGRVVEPLLELRETISIARAIRNRCIDIVDTGFEYGDLSTGGILGLLIELRELGVATSPDAVDKWTSRFERVCQQAELDTSDDARFLRGWCNSYRAGLELLANGPEQKLLGSDPTTTGRRSKPRF
jgi:hypothetical protein